MIGFNAWAGPPLPCESAFRQNVSWPGGMTCWALRRRVPIFDKTFFVLSPSYHGATLLAKLINAHPEVTALGDTMPSNRFDQVCGCGTRVSACHFWQAIDGVIRRSSHEVPARHRRWIATLAGG